MSAVLKYQRAVQQEEPVGTFIPYSNHVTRNALKLKTGDFVVTLRMQGAAHESADAQDINTWHEQLNGFMRNIASANVALWSHVVRRKFFEFPGGEFETGFARDLNEKYRASISAEPSLVNELYLSIVYRPQPNKAFKLLDALSSKSASELAEHQADSLAALQELTDTALAALDRYEPELLGCYSHRDLVFSEVGEFLKFLVDGEWRRVPVTRGEMSHSLATARPFFGKGGLMSLKGPTRTQYGAMLAIAEYASPTCPGLLNELLGMPFEFVLSQSFTFIPKQAALSRMQRQHARMVNAGDVAVSQVEEIEQAMDDLMSNRFVMGAHSLSLFIRADNQKDLSDNISDAGAALSDAGIKWARQEAGMAGAFFAQLPGNFAYRVRVGEITSRNFAGFSCFHNYPIGRIRGNQWGDAVTVFKTTSGSPFYFNFHKGEDGADAKRAAKMDPNHRDLANTLIVGKSGTGKTVLQLFLLAQMLKFNRPPKTKLSGVFFDKDLGGSIAIPAMGGRYFAIKNGVPTGWNPFQLPATESNLAFLEKFVRRLVQRADNPLTTEQEKEIYRAVHGVMATPPAMRRLRNVLQFLPQGDPEGLHARLSRWAGRGAPLEWLFDNDADKLNMDGVPVIGFDVSDFLENDETREPTMMYLRHRIEALYDGRRVATFYDEFGHLGKDADFQDLIDNRLTTVRKLDGLLVLGTQMPKQVLKNPISDTIVQQTATKIFLPNPEADHDDYVYGFKLTEREFEIIKGFGEKSRLFLVKQGGNSVVAELNLRGFDDDLAVLSGNAVTSPLAARVIAAVGTEPAAWLPVFHKERKAS